jgi:hypothetical protein
MSVETLDYTRCYGLCKPEPGFTPLHVVTTSSLDPGLCMLCSSTPAAAKTSRMRTGLTRL